MTQRIDIELGGSQQYQARIIIPTKKSYVLTHSFNMFKLEGLRRKYCFDLNESWYEDGKWEKKNAKQLGGEIFIECSPG